MVRQRSIGYCIRFSKSDFKRLAKNAQAFGVSLPAFVRNSVSTHISFSGNDIIHRPGLLSFSFYNLRELKHQVMEWQDHYNQSMRAIKDLQTKYFLNEKDLNTVTDEFVFLVPKIEEYRKQFLEYVKDIEQLLDVKVRKGAKVKTVHVRLSVDEKAELEQKAKALLLNVPDYVRLVCCANMDDARLECQAFLNKHRTLDLELDTLSLPVAVVAIRQAGYRFDDGLHHLNIVRASNFMTQQQCWQHCQDAIEAFQYVADECAMINILLQIIKVKAKWGSTVAPKGWEGRIKNDNAQIN